MQILLYFTISPSSYVYLIIQLFIHKVGPFHICLKKVNTFFFMKTVPS